MPAMDDESLRALISAEITAASGGDSSTLSQHRQEAMQYYRGERPASTGIEGRSAVVSRDVAEAIDQMMPPLMKIFMSGEQVFRFEPRISYGMSAEQVHRRCAQADQATEYVNWVFRSVNDGYRAVYDWFHDALRFRNGILKVWWDDTPHVTRERYPGLSDPEAMALVSDESVSVVEMTSRPDPSAAAAMAVQAIAGQQQGQPMPAMLAPPGGGPAPVPMVHDLVIDRTNMTGCVRVASVPLDEFLIASRSADIERNWFTCHRYRQSVGELIERFSDFEDEINNLPTANDDISSEHVERFRDADDLWSGEAEGDAFDPARRRVWVCESFIRVDYDGDGTAEMRAVITAGMSDGSELILQNEEVDDNPFAFVTPYIEPHAFWGRSITDQVMDIQDIKSALMRGALDTTYNANAPQLAVDTTADRVNLDDLLNRRPGGVVRTKGSPSEALFPIPTLPVAQDAYQMLAMMDNIREERTGVRRFSQGPGADALNNAYTDTATGAMMVNDSSQERIELIARNFAETGVKRVGRLILKAECQHRTQPTVAKLGDNWVPIDPREWDDQMDMTITVGLGTGNRRELVQNIGSLLALDEKIAMAQQGFNGPILYWDGVYAKLEKLCEAAGLKTASPYYRDPSSAPQQPQQPKPDPEMMKAQAQMAIAQQKAQTEAQLQQQRMQAEMQMQQAKLQADIIAQRVKAEFDMAMDRMRAQNDMQVEQMRAQNQAQIDAMRAHYEAVDDARNAELKARNDLAHGFAQIEADKQMSRQADDNG